jgi:hypothetical protein
MFKALVSLLLARWAISFATAAIAELPLAARRTTDPSGISRSLTVACIILFAALAYHAASKLGIGAGFAGDPPTLINLGSARVAEGDVRASPAGAGWNVGIASALIGSAG